MTAPGIPDVNYAEGWIEAKWMKTWPKKAETEPVRFGHPLTLEQGIWLWQRRLAGGSAFCCCQVERSWFFFDGMTIRKRFDLMTRPEMIAEAVFYMPKGMEAERLITWLRSHP